MTGREDILQAAIDLTTGDRLAAYGPPVENHQRIADLFGLCTGKEISAHEVAMLLHCVKLSRIRQTPDLRDSYIDGAAYLGIAWECISEGGAG